MDAAGSCRDARSAGISAATTTEASRGPDQEISLKTFAEKRRAYLLSCSETKKDTVQR